MSKMTVIRPEDIETAKQVVMTVANVEVGEDEHRPDLYLGAWLALDKSGVEANDDMLLIMGLVHHHIQEDAEEGEEISLESLNKYEYLFKWSDAHIRQYRYNRALAAEILQEEYEREKRKWREESRNYSYYDGE